ncbi:MAG: hypothetical protein VZR13_00270 [Saccharofermentanaceae bacterium]|nr:hypothetical protein [Saccharofermentanaceae bacterium]
MYAAIRTRSQTAKDGIMTRRSKNPAISVNPSSYFDHPNRSMVSF